MTSGKKQQVAAAAALGLALAVAMGTKNVIGRMPFSFLTFF